MDPSQFFIEEASKSQNLFLRVLGAIYFFAFLSLRQQALGLYGSNGVIPLKPFLSRLRSQYGSKLLYMLPSILHWWSDDHHLKRFLNLGILCSISLTIGFEPTLMLILLFILYLSYVSVGLEFMRFQWDSLLCEVGFAAIFYSVCQPPLLIFQIVFTLLLFRLMFASGVCKLKSGDPTWRDGTAMSYHYETQPLPTPFGWLFHQLPSSVLKASTFMMFFVELVVPFGIFGPSWVLIPSLVILAGLQVMIILTGNYCFFNILSIALLIPLIENRFIPFDVPEVFPTIDSSTLPLGALVPLHIVGLILITLNIFQLINLFYRHPWVQTVFTKIAPFNISNYYGLFSIMTTKRYEIVIEGSRNGENWKAYTFRWKPQKLDKIPGVNIPFQPRLDWQMWFAALGSYYQNPWLGQLMLRLAQGSPDVLSLMDHNPFEDEPPRFVRARIYHYHFTDFKTWRESGHWWRRELLGDYSPVMKQDKR